MATINFYLDKADKKGCAPIHMRINCNGKQVKIATGEKVSPEDFDKKNQRLKSTAANSAPINHYLTYLKERTDDLFHNSYRTAFTQKEIKEKLQGFVDGYKKENQVNIVKEQLSLYGQHFTFVDLFAGAGGFSEGFLQAEINNKFFQFLGASDINENCELTHVVRYNHQLNLDAGFLRQDITEPDFLDNLLAMLNGKQVDVVCGGPPCQSFSLAGKRKKFDKKDDLFSHYLQVIKTLQPKYFVMENVKGILTKEKGAIRKLVLNEINSIVDVKEIPKLVAFIKNWGKTFPINSLVLDCLTKRIEMEQFQGLQFEQAMERYIKNVEAVFRKLTPKLVSYKESKTDKRISTIRHGLNLLVRYKKLEKLKRDFIKEKDACDVDNDYFVDDFNHFLTQFEPDKIIGKIQLAFANLKIPTSFQEDCQAIVEALFIYTFSFQDCVKKLESLCDENAKTELRNIVDGIRLYKIERPLVVNSSDYGVPQNRERVLFIGCRKDQKFISTIPPTVSENEKVTVFEALYDLDFVGNDEEAFHYRKVNIEEQYNGQAKAMKKLVAKRDIGGKKKSSGKTFAQWSKEGRLNGRFVKSSPFYVKNAAALQDGEKKYDTLHNHKTSKQNETVVERLRVILENGGYKKAQDELTNFGLASKKRNYNVLEPKGQSPTVMTIPDDYIHYNSPRALTVREMARLQSFDDSFVFQGKRSTGGNKRKYEVPQFTLVGNAVPPLMARAVAMEILKNIKK